MAHAADRALEHAERSGDLAVLREARVYPIPARLYGPFPVEEALAYLAASGAAEAHVPSMSGQLEAMRGNFDDARRLIREGRAYAQELGHRLVAAGMSMQEEEVELTAGNAEAAFAAGLQGVADLRELGERGWLSTVAGHAAEALYRLGRDDEAWRMTETADEAGASDDVITQMLILQVRAKILSRRGEHAEAERFVREAVAWGEPTDALVHKADSYRDLAVVLGAAGKRDEALAALDRAQALYAEKGHTVGVALVDEMRAELVATLEA
jgi:tetratricopeptide (TPR) repeat protein